MAGCMVTGLIRQQILVSQYDLHPGPIMPRWISIARRCAVVEIPAQAKGLVLTQNRSSKVGCLDL
jgi:hypothetical protein